MLVVTSDKHLKRSLFIFRRIFGKDYQIDGAHIPCENLLDSREEREYLTVIKEFFKSLPKDIPDVNPDTWYQEHSDFYDRYREIHDKFHPKGKESQAYSGVRER